MAASTEALDYHRITRIPDRCTEGRHALKAPHCTPYGFEEIIGTRCTLHATERKRFFHATRTARPHLRPDIPLSLWHDGRKG